MASHLEINVKGIGAVTRPAERAIVSLKADSNHEETPQAASEAITAAATKIRELVNDNMIHDENNAIHPESAIAHWSMSNLVTNRRFKQASVSRSGDKTEDTTYYTAEAAFEIKFKDFGVLNTLATRFSAMQNITISNVTWALTDVTKDAIQGSARKQAAEHAKEKAIDYAEAFVGASPDKVKPVHVHEEPYYSQSTRPHLHREKGVRSVRTGSEELLFEPEDVRYEVTVAVKFLVDH